MTQRIKTNKKIIIYYYTSLPNPTRTKQDFFCIMNLAHVYGLWTTFNNNSLTSCEENKDNILYIIIKLNLIINY